MDGGAWWAAVRGVAKSRTRLSDFTFTLGGKVRNLQDLFLKAVLWARVLRGGSLREWGWDAQPGTWAVCRWSGDSCVSSVVVFSRRVGSDPL